MANWLDEFFEDVFIPSKHPLRGLLLSIYIPAVSSTALVEIVLKFGEQWLNSQFQVDPLLFRALLFLSVPLLVCMLFIPSKLVQWRGDRIISNVRPVKLTGTYPGLILVMSPRRGGDWRSTPAATSFRHHWMKGNGRLKYCWILCTNGQVEFSARNMVWELVNGKLVSHNDTEWVISDAENSNRRIRIKFVRLAEKEKDNPNQVFKCIKKIYGEARSLGLRPEDVIADYQGGTVSMTAGMVLACAIPERRLECLRPTAYLPDGRADTQQPSTVTYVDVSYKIRPTKSPRIDTLGLGG